MQQKMSRIKQVVFVALAIQLAVIILLQLIFKINILPGILVLIAESLIAVYLLDYFQSANEEESIGLEIFRWFLRGCVSCWWRRYDELR